MGATLIEMLVAVCLIDCPTKCRDVRLTYAREALTPLQCLMQAQPEIANWIREHPRWKVKRFTCRPAGSFAKI
jgi:hypothetical protein